MASTSPPIRDSPSSILSQSGAPVTPPVDSEELVELPVSAAVWSLSSAKPGNGIEQLLDNNPETFWQSDGSQPHTITVHLHRKTKLSDLWILFNYKSDESYTPLQISVRIGNGYFDLEEIQVVDLREPDGWVRVPLALPPDEGDRAMFRQDSAALRDKSFGGAFDFLRTHMLQVAVISNHQNGRDTHIRGVKLFSPREHKYLSLSEVSNTRGAIDRIHHGIRLITPEFTSMAQIR